ncbi:hypothetical protein [Oceanithermus desulfurans]|uniref:Uncharacterized protein n=2 Tax=Oceanithermus desulfurans TaxID=227924 RepID=A0A511RLV1_9DEIN|nr:hypothetical protein [Oceanithermus desulfurans]MBB6030794.1 hypothetical protein [Oceanithermus desulfurans]GEM90641.1 hypothetical protein ODE01S_20750 [Oceanithermus desulfurans NBRC 100063]
MTKVTVDRTVGIRRTARAIVYAAGVSLVTLGLLYAGLPVAGPLNDLANATIGLFSLLLVRQLHGFLGPTKPGLFVGLGSAGGLALILGALPVALGVLHWTTGGMVTGFGYGLLGAWLLGASHGSKGTWMRGLGRLGTTAGALMSLGLIAGPDLGLRVVPAPATWGLYLATASGILLYFVWCWRLAGALSALGHGR